MLELYFESNLKYGYRFLETGLFLRACFVEVQGMSMILPSFTASVNW